MAVDWTGYDTTNWTEQDWMNYWEVLMNNDPFTAGIDAPNLADERISEVSKATGVDYDTVNSFYQNQRDKFDQFYNEYKTVGISGSQKYFNNLLNTYMGTPNPNIVDTVSNVIGDITGEGFLEAITPGLLGTPPALTDTIIDVFDGSGTTTPTEEETLLQDATTYLDNAGVDTSGRTDDEITTLAAELAALQQQYPFLIGDQLSAVHDNPYLIDAYDLSTGQLKGGWAWGTDEYGDPTIINNPYYEESTTYAAKPTTAPVGYIYVDNDEGGWDLVPDPSYVAPTYYGEIPTNIPEGYVVIPHADGGWSLEVDPSYLSEYEQWQQQQAEEDQANDLAYQQWQQNWAMAQNPTSAQPGSFAGWNQQYTWSPSAYMEGGNGWQTTPMSMEQMTSPDVYGSGAWAEQAANWWDVAQINKNLKEAGGTDLQYNNMVPSLVAQYFEGIDPYQMATDVNYEMEGGSPYQYESMPTWANIQNWTTPQTEQMQSAFSNLHTSDTWEDFLRKSYEQQPLSGEGTHVTYGW